MAKGNISCLTFVTLAILVACVRAQHDYDEIPMVAKTNLTRALNDRCNYDGDCFLQNGYCDQSQNKCVCKIGFKLNDKRDDCVAAVGALCKFDHDCGSLRYSRCYQETCSCIEGYVPHPMRPECLARAHIGEHCEVAEQCHYEGYNNAHCIKEVCVCTENHHISPNNTCIASKGPFQYCVESYECDFGEGMKDRTRCFENKCVCKEEWPITEDNKCGSGAIGAQVWSSVFTLALMASVAKIITI